MKRHPDFSQTIDTVVTMCEKAPLRKAVQQLGLNLVNVMWEDTARTPGSVWGDNISDMTLQVRYPNYSSYNPRTGLLPVIRYPNFTDITGDVPIDWVRLKVGNQAGKPLEVVTLRDYLLNLSDYVSLPEKLHTDNQPLVTDQDTHVLVSAQACFLPIPAQGTCEFNPVLFNYQSRQDSPAVLTLLVTTEGTSLTVVDNAHDQARWGQNLYFNNNGQKTCLTGERLSDYKENQAKAIAQAQGISMDAAREQVTVAQDINMVMVFQVPLKRVPPKNLEGDCDFEVGSMELGEIVEYEASADLVLRACSFSDVEDAAIGHGDDEGEHIETCGYRLERDSRYPIRITVQFYKATSNGIVDDKDLNHIHQCIQKSYESAEYIGSLVIGTLEKGELGMGEARPTQPAPSKNPVVSPPKDFLTAVNPFAPNQNPMAGK